MEVTRRSAVLSLLVTTLTLPAAASLSRDPRPRVERFLKAVEEGEVGLVSEMLAVAPELARARDASGRSALVIAYLARQREVARMLDEAAGEKSAVEAVMGDDWERFDALVAADPSLCHALQPIGGTLLHAAALVGGNEMWRLRAAGCKPDARPAEGNGFTAARSAMDCRWETGARIAATELLANGSNANAEQARGDSVLHGAVRRQSEALVRLAVRKGADVEHRDDAGRTARELALELDWEAGAKLLANAADLPRDHRASRFALDADLEPVKWIDLSDVSQERQSEVTSNSHANLPRVRELLEADPRLVFSISTDDELAIEASAHLGNRELIRYHLDHGAPLSLPTAVALGDTRVVKAHLERDARLVHERGAHDFPVMYYLVLGGCDAEMGELLVAHGVGVDQESQGATALHWCVLRDQRDLARWLIDKGANLEPVSYKWNADGETPHQMALSTGRGQVAQILRAAGARALEPGVTHGAGGGGEGTMR